MLVFIEVKTGERFATVHPLENITSHKILKLQSLINYYIAAEKVCDRKINEIRLDAAVVLHDEGDFKINIIESLPMPWA